MTIKYININERNFLFLNTNRQITTNSNLKCSIREDGILLPITVIPSEFLDDTYQLCAFENGKLIPISEEKKENGLVVLDGQHRLKYLKEILSKNHNKDLEEIPVNILENKDIKGDINKYIIKINNTANKWKKSDFINNSVKVRPDDKLIQVIESFQKLGFSMSTISRYLCFNNHDLTEKTLEKYTYDMQEINNADYKRAICIYNFFKRKGFDNSFLKKRYLIDFIIEKLVGKKIDELLSEIDSFEVETLKQILGQQDRWKSLEGLSEIKTEYQQTLKNICKRNSIKYYISEVTDETVEKFIRESTSKKKEKPDVKVKSKQRKIASYVSNVIQKKASKTVNGENTVEPVIPEEIPDSLRQGIE